MDILVALDAGRSTALLILDLFTAFDTTNHDIDILIHRLQHWFATSSTALNLSFFLSDHFQIDIAPNSKSQTILLK